MPKNEDNSASPSPNEYPGHSCTSVCVVGDESSGGIENKKHADDDDDDAKGDELHLVDGYENNVKVGEDGEEKNLEDEDMGGVGGEKEQEEENNEEDDSRLGLDKGYAWCVVLGAFLSWVLASGFMKSGAIFFLQFQTHFKKSAFVAAWPVSVLAMLQNLTGPLVSAVCNRYSVRTSVMIGTAMTLVGLILNSLVDDFNFLFFCYSLLQGVGLGFVMSPGLYIISSYFDKHRGFATSLASAGGGVGTFAMVPIITHLFDVYGFHGCFLILAGMLSNCFVSAMLFRPLRTHQQYLLALRKKENRALCLNDDVKQNGDDAHIPLKEITTPSSTTNSTIPPPAQHHKPPTFCFQLKSSLKVCFPVEHQKTTERKMFHFELLKNVSVILYLISTFFFTLALKAIYTFIPAACIDKGLSKSDAALVLSIAGAVDTVGQIGCGYVLDRPKLKPHRVVIFNIFLYIVALWGYLMPFLDSFVGFVLVSGLLGFCFGAHISQRTVVLVDLMGMELLPSWMGFLRLSQAFGMLVGPLLFGALRDATGNYDVAFYAGSSLLILASIIMTLGNLSFKRQKRKKERLQQQEEQ